MNWPLPTNTDAVPSPGLLIDPARVERNIRKMADRVGGAVGRLRPHVKTHKMSEVMRLQLEAGIASYKAATLAEVEMAAGAGAGDVLLAYQPVGPNIARLRRVAERHPAVGFAAVTDDLEAARSVAAAFRDAARPLRLFIDVDCGMHRTGIAPGPSMDSLRRGLASLPGIEFGGLHVYDGHLHDPSLEERRRRAGEIIASVRALQESDPAPAVVIGGSPTFGIHAELTDWQCSPGTTLLWDAGYGGAFPDLDFEIAAVLLSRVISKPGPGRICVDLGHKAVAAENPLDRRVYFPQLPGAVAVSQSEEHLVLETGGAGEWSPGDILCGYPQHICPTVALHAVAHVVRDGRCTGETWAVTARDRAVPGD